MKRYLTLILLFAGATASPAAPPRFLDTQIESLLKTTNDALTDDAALKGKAISLGRFGSERRPDSQYGPELKRLFEAKFKKLIVPDGLLTLTVDYDVITSDTDVAEGAPDGQKMTVLLVTVLIKDDNRRELFRKSAEVNDTADISRVMGVPVSPPPQGTQHERNRKLEETFNQNKGKRPNQVTPNFQVRNDTRIGNKGDNKFFVEVQAKATPDGPATALAPTATPRGDAFVDLKAEQFYELVIHNADEHDCVAQIRVDGQDVLNRFNADGVTYPGLLVEAGKKGLLKGWFHTVKRGKKDNVFAFAVKEYAFGSEQAKAIGSDAGMITVQVAGAWKGNDPRPAGRGKGRFTEKGPSLEQDFTVEPRQIGEFNETIAIRYSPTAK